MSDVILQDNNPEMEDHEILSSRNYNQEFVDIVDEFARGLGSLKIPPIMLAKILKLILPIISFFMKEHEFRYILGAISYATSITNAVLAECAHRSPKTITRGRKDYKLKLYPSCERQRSEGGGRKSIISQMPYILTGILKFVELRSYGPCTKDIADYTAATITSIQKFVSTKYRVQISRATIWTILASENIRLRTNKKLLYGNQGKETDVQRTVRHLQFDYIHTILELINDENYIVLSIDCKKKEVLGRHKPSGKTYTFKGRDAKSDDHDYHKQLIINSLKDLDDLLDREEGKAIPYGMYDIAMNKAYINVGISHDTPQFVAASLAKYMEPIKKDHPKAKTLILLCDGGGSNNARSKIFKYYMAQLSKMTGLRIHVVHYPPYRSKFNYIERRVFAPISKQFERMQLYNLRTVVELIKNTPSTKGLEYYAELDTGVYELNQKVTDEQMSSFAIEYVGPTKGFSVQLSYTIDGTNLNASDIVINNRLTVFEVKAQNDHVTEEKLKMKEEKVKAKTTGKKTRTQKEVPV